MKQFVLAALSVVAAAVTPCVAMAQADGPVKDETSQIEAGNFSDNPNASIAHMTLGYTYFNRPGADLKTHNAELIECVGAARHTYAADQAAPAYNHGLIGNLVIGEMQIAYHHGAVASALENCMVVRGWRVVKLPDMEGDTLSKLPAADLAQRLAPWVGAADPHGKIVRIWSNEAANSATTRFNMRPGHINNGQLSLLEATNNDLRQFDAFAGPDKGMVGALSSSSSQERLTSASQISVGDGQAVVLIQMQHLSGSNGYSLFLNQLRPSSDDPLAQANYTPATLVVRGSIFKSDGQMFAFVVPPGKWRIAGMGTVEILNFCLGAPSFQVAAGEVVYTGSFDFAASSIGPDLDLTPAKAWLGGSPLASRLRPAAYTNGSTGVCGGNHIYALEVKGAPFEPGYAWGSLAAAAK